MVEKSSQCKGGQYVSSKKTLQHQQFCASSGLLKFPCTSASHQRPFKPEASRLKKKRRGRPLLSHRPLYS